MTTIRDVARLAQVSTATVSRVFASDTAVRPDTAERVRRAARELGYVPNSLARSLRQQTSATWALIIADIENPFLTQVTRGVEDVAQSAGYSLLLCNTDENPEKEEGYLSIAAQYRVSGVLITPTSATSRVDRLLSRGLPVITMDRPLRQDLTVDTVLIDSRRAARTAVDRMIAHGHRRIACITGPQRVFTASERVLGYREALQDAGLPIDENLIHYAAFNENGGRQATDALLETADVEAILVANSMMAVGVLRVLRDRQLTPGQDVELVVFDDAPWTGLLTPAISVIHQPAYELGQTAGKLLLDRLRSPGQPARTVMLNATLPPDGEAPLPRVRRPDLATTDPVTSAILTRSTHLNP
ncbi:LacI family transcriptional regulator [Micromonospora sp. DR5-3]|uniref:LacI family DNA-binding transcriptional regulator n=1 Tax=unclassified Micromonospora TaxID=2617518 RepID=UPI0011D3669D|nr:MULTISPECIES: LacI family DNA-binding transcriptional regulator [unclassified Micromonospora]MCW3819830.1 LacI family transcriptional regulator [Micromonospora sp. DR5-3]TYC20196.1 LacI family transcriptional regulator [Micromonospora sp. MP36]